VACTRGAGSICASGCGTGATDAELAALLRETWQHRADRGAEERLAVRDRGALYAIAALRADPHREMHTGALTTVRSPQDSRMLNKITVVGAGNVGATPPNALANRSSPRASSSWT